MPDPVILLGLDALPPGLLESWVADGELPVLGRLMAQGAYARQKNFDLYRTENSWLTLLQGCSPHESHEWGHQVYSVGSYETIENAAYEFRRYPPFYALQDRRVAVFDVPLVGLVPGVDGVQLLGWGTEVNQILRESFPPYMMGQLIARHGRHPLYDTIVNAEDGTERLSYRIPCIYDVDLMRTVRGQLIDAVRQRTAIILDLIDAERWDLLFCVYAEIHTAGHLFWHLGRDHPLQGALHPHAGGDYMLEIMREIDRGIGQILERLPEDDQLLIFSPHGMQANSLDLYSMLFLPELLYRWSSGHAAFQGKGSVGEAVAAPRLDYRRHWRDEVWDLRTDHGGEVLESPATQEARHDPLDWDPGNWYRPLWPRMRAFTLPGYSEGLIRINVAGRDGPEGVEPTSYDAICDELTQLVMELVDARSGEAMAQEVIRVRKRFDDDGPNLSPADLIVVWRDALCTDVVDHSQLGRIGPVPFFRSGGHATEGFLLTRGVDVVPGRAEDLTTEDVTKLILQKLGSPLPKQIA